jgi:nitrite reductase/ring-hydroxylating ferredoxin subunit
MTSRRDFLKSACALCAVAGGLGVLASALQGCAAIPVVKTSPVNRKMRVAISSFQESQYVLVRQPNSMADDILLVKKSDTLYNALLLQCTHQQQPLTVSGNTINCPTHGSTFDLDGKVQKEPATVPLTRYETSIEGDVVVIDLSAVKKA